MLLLQNGWLAFKDHMNHLVLDRLKRFPGQVIWKEYTPQVSCSSYLSALTAGLILALRLLMTQLPSLVNNA